MPTTEPISNPSATTAVVEKKIVIVISAAVPRGASDNRAAVLATGMAAKHPEIIGPAPVTADGVNLTAFTKFPIVILVARPTDSLVDLTKRAQQVGCTALVFLARAQGMRSYDAYCESIGTSNFDELDIDSIMLFGEKRSINKLVGSLPAFK